MGEAQPWETIPPVTRLSCLDQGMVDYTATGAADIRLSSHCPAAKLQAGSPCGVPAVPADKLFQPLLKEI